MRDGMRRAGAIVAHPAISGMTARLTFSLTDLPMKEWLPAG